MELKKIQRLYILNPSDVDRVDAAVDLLRQALADLIEARQIKVPLERHSPGSLYALSDEAAEIHEERMQTEIDF